MENLLDFDRETGQPVGTREMDGKFLTFWIDRQLFGVPIADVLQIVGMQDITPVPEFPYYAKGIINLRGSILSVIDVRLRLGKQERDYDERTCIIVTQMGERVTGFIVDEVDAVTAIDADVISPPPDVSGAMGESYITGVAQFESRTILLMDTVKMLPADYLADATPKQ